MCSREQLCIPDNMKLLDDVNTRGNEEDELNNAARTLRKMMATRAGPGYEDPHLIPVKRQVLLFHTELEQIRNLIKLARSGGHAIRDANRRVEMERELRALERLNLETTGGRRQLQELSCLAYLTQKQLIDLESSAPNERQYLQGVMDSTNKLSQMENRLDIATKQFNVMNASNLLLQKEITRLLIERNNFNAVWYRLIAHLVTGKLYLLDVLATANRAFSERSDCISKLNALKWKANFELDRDIHTMQDLQHMLDHLQKLEEFLRLKGTLRVCEAVKIELRKQEEADLLKSNEIEELSSIIDGIRDYCENKSLRAIVEEFDEVEASNMAIFRLICFVYADYKDWQLKLGPVQNEINNQRINNSSTRRREVAQLQILIERRNECHQSAIDLQSENTKFELILMKTIRGIEELARAAKINYGPLINMLGSGRTIHKYNVMVYLLQIQRAVMNCLVVFEYKKSVASVTKKPEKKVQVKKEPLGPSLPTPGESVPVLVGDKLRPNHINKLVTYQPCAYCVEEFIMNQVRDQSWEVFTDEDAMDVLRLEKPNTPFSIFTITDPSKRHAMVGVTTAE